MKLYHSTQWEVLCSLLSGELLSASSFSAADLLNPRLRLLDDHGLNFIWFSSQPWTDNRFGPYVLRYETDDLVLPTLVPLGRHHGARCFISAPGHLARWIAGLLDLTLISPDHPQFQQADRDDRIDVLVPWKVPLAESLYVVEAKTGRGKEDHCNFARARLHALGLLTDDASFHPSLVEHHGEAEAAHNLLGELVGSFDRHDHEAQGSLAASDVAREHLREALEHFVAVDLQAARIAAARIGPVRKVADEIAASFNRAFGTDLSGHDVESG